MKHAAKLSQHLYKKIQHLPHQPGVYIMRDQLGHVIYVGKAIDLKKRVSSYFYPSRKFKLELSQPKIASLISLIHDIEIIEVQSEAESLLLESKLIKQFKPKYNTSAKDDKRFLLIRVDIQNTLPQFRLVRNKTDAKSLYFGPFVDATSVRKTLSQLRLEFGILLGDTHPKLISENTYQLYDDVRSEIYGHSNEVSVNDYKTRVNAASHFLEGHTHTFEKEIEQKMFKASKNQDFEKAADLRDLLFAIRQTTAPHRKFLKDLPQEKDEQILQKLSSTLKANLPFNRIECFDISHISGTFVVASLVSFLHGKPDKNNYRRYKIQTFIGNDDYKAMQEVVSRRYTRLSKETLTFPDLIVIDGGIGQVHAALKAFQHLNLTPPMIIGLAKKKETIIFADGREPLNLALNNPVLHLLQRIRDEAHRFANAFNADLRSKRLQESALDNFTGIGPVRKATLLRHFKNLGNLKKASIQDLAEVPGIGLKTAQDLHSFLQTI